MTHDHDHAEFPQGWAFGVGVALNSLFVLVEVTFGLLAHSVALVADAAHNLSDVLGLLLAWGASILARRRPTQRRTYGMRRSTLLAALANAGLLLVAVGGVAWEAIGRLRSPSQPEGWTMLVVAAVGVVINGLSALLFFKGREHDANVRGAFLHLVADATVSLGVVVAGAAVLKTGWSWIDPVVSLVVSVVILGSTWSLLRESLDLLLDAVPEHIDPEKVCAYLAGLPGVREVHDLHIWAMSTTEVALTAHLIVPQDSCHPAFLRDAGRVLHDRFGIEHATLQVESIDAPTPCQLASEEKV